MLKVLPEEPLELESGDMVLFHCNTLHASDDNRSDEPRIALLGCFNTRHNSPYITSGHPGFSVQERIVDPITAADLDVAPVFA